MCSTESISPAISEASGFPDFHSIKPLTDRFIARLKGETLESNEHKIYQSGHVRADQNTTFPETSEWRLLRLGPIRDRHPNGRSEVMRVSQSASRRAKMLKYPGLPPSVPRKILQHTSGKTNTSVDYFLIHITQPEATTGRLLFWSASRIKINSISGRSVCNNADNSISFAFPSQSSQARNVDHWPYIAQQ